MDTLPPYTVSSRKRRKSNSSTEEHESDVEEEYVDPDWNLAWPRFIVMSPLDDKEPLTKLSPFAVEKAILGKFGTVQKVTKMKSGSLLIEATRAKQSRMIRDTTSFLNIEVKCTPHRSLNSSRGVIRDHGAPWGRRGRIRPQHPLACRKRRLNGAACLPWAATRVA